MKVSTMKVNRRQAILGILAGGAAVLVGGPKAFIKSGPESYEVTKAEMYGMLPGVHAGDLWLNSNTGEVFMVSSVDHQKNLVQFIRGIGNTKTSMITTRDHLEYIGNPRC